MYNDGIESILAKPPIEIEKKKQTEENRIFLSPINTISNCVYVCFCAHTAQTDTQRKGQTGPTGTGPELCSVRRELIN